MEKKLEAELMSLAHKILQLSGRDNIKELRDHARALYEKLTVLSFVDEHFSTPQPTIGRAEAIKALKAGFGEAQPGEEPSEVYTTEEEGRIETPVADSEPEAEEAIPPIEDAQEENHWEEGWTPSMRESSEEEHALSPKEEEKEEIEEKVEENETFAVLDTAENSEGQEVLEDGENDQIEEDTLADISVHLDDLPEFERIFPSSEPKESLTSEEVGPPPETKSEEIKPNEEQAPAPNLFSEVEKPRIRNDLSGHPKNLNEKFQYGLKFGLNDRLAFTQHLFEGNASDFNRIISQLNTLEDYAEAERFIEEQVKPDYDWSEQEVYEKRFLSALEHKMG